MLIFQLQLEFVLTYLTTSLVLATSAFAVVCILGEARSICRTIKLKHML